MLKENKPTAKIINSCENLSRTKDKGSSMLLKVKFEAHSRHIDIKFESAFQSIKFGKSTPWLG